MKVVDRRTPTGSELLEVYQFVPLIDECTTYSVADAARICVQLCVEKLLWAQLTVTEYLDINAESLIEQFRDVLRITPKVNGTFKLVTDRDYQMESIEIVPTTQQKDRSKYSIVVWNAAVNEDEVCRVLDNVRSEGFLVMVRHKQHAQSFLKPPKGFTLVSVVQTSDLSLVIFQHETTTPIDYRIVRIDSSDRQFSWLKEVQASNTADNVILLSERDPTSGALGFYKSVRLEPNVPNFRCVVIEDENAPLFDIENPFYSSQIRLNLPVNIVRSGKWGTFRQLALSPEDNIEVKQSNSLCVEVGVRGKLESLVWVPRPDTDADTKYILVKYVGLDKRDVMIATGEMSENVFDSDSANQDGCFGREFSGIDANGRNVMGTKINGGALATRIENISNDFIFNVPDSISLEEASTMPLSYLTAYAAFFTGTEMLSDRNILIHSGLSHHAIAATRTALTYGFDVHTTVSSLTEKLVLRNVVPELNASNVHIRPSQFFGQKIGCVLSFTPEDEMEENIRCLKDGGMLILFEPFDADRVAESSKILFEKGISVKIVSLTKIAQHSSSKKLLTSMINADLERGVMKPLPSKVFDFNQMNDAFAAMSCKKVVISIPTENEIANKSIVKGKLAFVACPKSVYIITGGLGGFGLELANWLIMRGAKILIMASRNGPVTAYQQYRLRFWKSLGCDILINKNDITSVDGCEQLLRDSNAHGKVAGIFCLAAVILDRTLSNLTEDLFKRCFAPKTYSTQHLDKLSRVFCPELKHFVAFSSVASSRSCAGQSNYAMANAVVDRIVENRVRDKLPGKSIQWGPVSDVGMVARLTNNKTDILYSGMQQQRIDRCLHALDNLLVAKHPIVS